MDYSATSFVTGLTVDKAVDKLDATYEPLSENCKIINKECKQASHVSFLSYLGVLELTRLVLHTMRS